MTPRAISGNEFLLYLCKQLGLEWQKISRIVIDAQYNAVVRVYIEKVGDERLLSVNIPSSDIEVIQEPPTRSDA